MKVNPIYHQESKASARSFKLPMIVLLFNCVLAVVALLDMYSMITQVRLTAEIQYSSFLGLYVFVAAVEFVLLLFIIPGLTGGSISGERERQTLDLMLTTRLTAADIVFGKLAAGLSTVFLLIVSSFPILSLVFIYGGVTMPDVGLLLLCYVVTAVLVGSVGIFCSAALKRSTVATAAAYAVVLVLVAGTIMVSYLAEGFEEITTLAGSSGPVWPLYLLLCNPAVMFQSVLTGQVGNEEGMALLTPLVGRIRELDLLDGRWWECSMLVQIAMSGAFLWAAVRQVTPRSRRKKGTAGL